MADFRQLLQDIRKKNFSPVYILMGEEPYYIDILTDALEESVVAPEDKEFDQAVLYGADTNGALVAEAASQFPMVGEKRLVILKEAQAMNRAKAELDKLKHYVSTPNDSTVLCIAFKGEKLSATSELLKAAKKNKEIVVFDSPRIKEYKLGEVIKDYCNSKKVKIEEKAVELLIENIGSSLAHLFSEIDKVGVAIAGKEKIITADIVSDHIGVSREFNNFELVSALSRRDYLQTLKILNYFEENPKANPTIITSAMIFTYFQRLVLAAFSQDKSDSALMKVLQLKTPYALKEIRMGLSHYNAAQLINAIHAIRDFDAKVKGIGSFQKEYPLLKELALRLITI